MDIGVSVHDDGSAVHEVADIAPRVTLDADHATLHASPVTPVGRTQVVSGIPFNDEFHAFHTDARKCVNISLHEEFSALHPGTGIHVGIIFDDNLAGGHLHADVLHPAHIALDHDTCVSGSRPAFPGDLEVLPECELVAALEGMEGSDLACFLPGKIVRGDGVRLKVESGLVFNG